MQTLLEKKAISKKKQNTEIIRLQNISKGYPAGDKVFYALDGIDVNIQQGQYVTILGRSGSGKSTFLNIVTGIDQPETGEIEVDGTSLLTLSENKLAKWRGQNIGIVFQFFQLLPTLSIIENILLPMDFCKKIPVSKRISRAHELLKMCGIEDQAFKLPSTLSGGQKQRAAIARALANDPAILVADEPTGNLDTATTKNILDLFITLKKKGKTLIIVTHEQELALHSDRIIHLEDGRIIKDQLNNKEGR